MHCGVGTSISLRGHISLVQGRNIPASFWAPVQGAGEEKYTFYSGKMLDQSKREVLMHRCFLSLGLTWCRSLPLQASIEALLINLLKCRFSNIIMTEHCCLLMGKKLTPAAREEPQPDRSKGRMEAAALLNGTAKWRKEQTWSRGRIFEAAITKKIMHF